jgi:multidrug efflux pump subunit AcrB/outer membrane protein TolC
MKNRTSFVESAMKNRQIVFLFIGLLILLGIFALKTMPRQEFPTVTIRQGLIVGAYPGATSHQVEEQLTTPVERYLFSYREIIKAKTYSYSRDGLMIIFIELNDNVKDADEFWSKLKHGLNNLKPQLPPGVAALFADNDFGDTSALLITLEADNKSYRELEVYLNKLEDRLRRIESVSKIRHYGLQKEQVSIYLEKNKLEKYGISNASLMFTLFSHGFTAAGGSVDDGVTDTPIHVTTLYQHEEDIAEQIIFADPNGHMIRLKDIARIVREYPQPESYILNNAKKCLVISLEMEQGNNIVEYGAQVDKVLHDFQHELPAGVTMKRIADQPKVVGDSIHTFLLELIYAIISVVLVTMVLLPLRVASVAASSIPITIFISLGLMLLFGIELNTVTLAALIVVLGMIVDNSVVIVDSYMEKLDLGMSRWYAAISSAKTYFKAIFSATLAISITFFPFLFTLKGMFRDFVKMFPWTVTITLGISLMVAMMVIPFLEFFFIREGFHQVSGKKKKFNILAGIQRTYEKYLKVAFKKPGFTLGIGFASVACGIVLFTLIPQRLMPVAERNQFAVEIYLTQGTSLSTTAQVCDSLERILQKDNRITSITSFVGTSSPRFHVTYAPKIPAKNYAQFIVNTVSSQATEDLLNECSSKYTDFFPNAYIRFKQLDYQHASSPVEVRISGDSLPALKQAGDSIASLLRTVEGIAWAGTDFWEMLPVDNVTLNRVEANRLGIDKTTVATNLALRFHDIPVTTLWENDYPVAVKLKTVNTGPQTAQDINNEYIHSLIPSVSVPLRQIASVTGGWEQGQLVRRNGVRTLTVMADIERGKNVNTLFPKVKELTSKYNLPEGLRLSFGGIHETDEETLPRVIGGLIISIFIIFLILVLHFRKIGLALLVLGSASLSLLGAALGVLLLKVEFGITSILGIVSLIGILVRNGIIMLDYAEELRLKHKMTVKDAIFEAGKRRMRPIFLTSAAASMGVIPMIISSNPLWTPMGAVISFGTMTSMVFLVFVLPVAYWKLFEQNEEVKPVASSTKQNGRSLLIILTLIFFSGCALQVEAQNSYTLEDCLKLALENNTLVKNSNLEIQAAQQVKKSAVTKYFPKTSAAGASFRFNDPLIQYKIPGGNLPVYDGNPVNLLTPTEFAYFPGISLSMANKGMMGSVTAIQPVFTGGRIISGNNLAALGVSVSREKLNLSENEVLLATEQQYWRIVSLREKMKTLEITDRLLDSLYREANDAWRAGLINRNEVLKVTLKQSELRGLHLKLDNGIKLSSMALCQYLGISYDKDMQLADSLNVLVPPGEVFLNHDQALPNREEYKLLQQGIKAATLQTRLKMGEYLPQAGVGVGALYYDIPDKGTINTMVFATVTIPISDWWEAVHTLKERKCREQITENDSRNKEELLLLQMQKIWNELNEAFNQIEIATETIRQAEENLKINQDNYKAGMVNISDMLEAHAMLQQARDGLTDARTGYKIKLTEYMQATGRYRP